MKGLPSAIFLLLGLGFMAVQALATSEMFNPFTGQPDYIADLPEICDGPQGPQGFRGYSGSQGERGADGAPGVGVPVGGTDGQYLAKKGLSNYSTQWVTPSTTVEWQDITGTLNGTTRPDLFNAFEPKNSNIQAHIGATNNPHATTADQVLPSQTGQSGKVLGTNGSTASWVAGGSGTPGGSSKQVQYNNAGAFGGFGRYSANPGGGGCLIL